MLACVHASLAMQLWAVTHNHTSLPHSCTAGALATPHPLAPLPQGNGWGPIILQDPKLFAKQYICQKALQQDPGNHGKLSTQRVRCPAEGIVHVQWMAPEVLAHQRYSQKADVYSFALVAWECAARQVLLLICVPTPI